jgi:hypothetical protein
MFATTILAIVQMYITIIYMDFIDNEFPVQSPVVDAPFLSFKIVLASVAGVFLVNNFDHLPDNLLPPNLPFFPICQGIIQICNARLSKHATCIQLFRKRNDVKVEEAVLNK